MSAGNRVLALAALLEHLVNPTGRQCSFQRQPCHHARWRMLFESIHNNLPHSQPPIHQKNQEITAFSSARP
jgi:hypothetical protein